MNPKVDWFFAKETKWQEAYEELRSMVPLHGLQEELKWGCPCYTWGSNNIVLIHGFKDYCALLFMQGGIAEGSKEETDSANQNVQAQRQLRFASVEEIRKKVCYCCFVQRGDCHRQGRTESEIKKDLGVRDAQRVRVAKMPCLIWKGILRVDTLAPAGYLLVFLICQTNENPGARVEKFAVHFERARLRRLSSIEGYWNGWHGKTIRIIQKDNLLGWRM